MSGYATRIGDSVYLSAGALKADERAFATPPMVTKVDTLPRDVVWILHEDERPPGAPGRIARYPDRLTGQHPVNAHAPTDAAVSISTEMSAP
jgi:hypothetical protein